MKRLVFLLGLCVCMVYGGEYDKQKAEFMSKNFESKLRELVKESGLKGNDANGGWSIYTISLSCKGSNGRYYFWNSIQEISPKGK